MSEKIKNISKVFTGLFVLLTAIFVIIYIWGGIDIKVLKDLAYKVLLSFGLIFVSILAFELLFRND